MTAKIILKITVAAAVIALGVYSVVLVVDNEPDSFAYAEAKEQQSVPPSRDRLRGPHRRAGDGARPSRQVPGPFAAPTDEPDAPLSMEEQLQRDIAYETERQAAFMAKFDAESVDGRWAAQWESTLTSTLEASLGKHPGFSMMTIECRSERCLAHAQWNDYGSATLALGDAADATKGACATSVFMPPPEDKSAPYRHSVRFSACQDDPL